MASSADGRDGDDDGDAGESGGDDGEDAGESGGDGGEDAVGGGGDGGEDAGRSGNEDGDVTGGSRSEDGGRDLVARVLRTPVVRWLVVVPVVLAAAVQTRLGPRSRALEEPRHRWWLRASGALSFLGGYAIDRAEAPEYVCTVRASPAVLERRLWRAGFHRNLLAAKKYRRTPGGRQWSTASWVGREQFLATEQFHVTLFERPGGVDCYAHREPSNVTRLLDHWCRRDQVAGDPEDRLRDALDDAGLDRFRDETLTPIDRPAAGSAVDGE